MIPIITREFKPVKIDEKKIEFVQEKFKKNSKILSSRYYFYDECFVREHYTDRGNLSFREISLGTDEINESFSNGELEWRRVYQKANTKGSGPSKLHNINGPAVHHNFSKYHWYIDHDELVEYYLNGQKINMPPPETVDDIKYLKKYLLLQ